VAGNERGGDTADAVQKQAQSFRCGGGKRRWFGWSVAEALLLHLFCGRGEAPGTPVVHGDKPERLRERDAVGAGLQEFDVGADFAVHRIQGDITQGSMGNRAFREDGGTSGERQALKHADKANIVD